MARCASGPALGTTYDGFLFAAVGDEKNGPLSVLSALARLDIDPWGEAGVLARLPKDEVIARLADRLKSLPDGPSPPWDTKSQAARLIGLLPSRAILKAKGAGAPAPTGWQANADAARFTAFHVISMLIVVGVQSFAASHHPQTSKTASATSTPVGPVVAAKPAISHP
jgi:hypothetical protein